MAGSMILHHQLENAPSPLFRFAIFIASPIPFSKTLDYGIDTRRYFGMPPTEQTQPARLGCPTEIPSYLVTDKSYLRGEAELEGKPLSSMGDTYYQMFHSSVDSFRIHIPVAHIYGRLDPWYRHSVDLVGLCEKNLSSVLEHEGGHDVPRDMSEEMCDLVENTVAQAGLF